MLRSIVLIAALCAAPLALANTPVMVDRGDFDAQRAAIEKALADGKTYAEISDEDRSTVQQSLDRMSDLVGGGKPVDALTPPQKVALFNDQEIVNTLLTQAEADSRVTCVHTKKVGSHRRSVVCTTAAERARSRNQSQDALQGYQRVIPIAQPIGAPGGF